MRLNSDIDVVLMDTEFDEITKSIITSAMYQPSTMSTTFLTSEDVENFITDNLETTYKFRGESQEFLPRCALAQVTTKDVIRLVAIKDKNLFLNDEDLEHFIDQVHRRAPKLFAICFFSALPMSYLKGLLDENISDANLPLTQSHCINPRLRQSFRRVISSQKVFYVPYLGMNFMQTLDDITKPIHFNEGEESLLGNGAFGDVYEVKIHKDHRSFSCGANSSETFAMKVTRQRSREPKFHEIMAELDHPHLLKCLASFTASSQYHMVYEKADKDLEKLMKQCNEATNLSSFSDTDLAGQLHGLVGALCVVHNQENIQPSSNTGFLNVPHKPRGRGKSGYIHDIKPDNILVFIYEVDGKKTYWFRLSDYSSANVVDLIDSVSGQNRFSRCTDNRKCTPDYRAPEYLCEEGISRPFDLWSLGCVFLELLIWFTEDFDALQAFREARLQRVKPGGIEDQGFWYTNEEGRNPTAHVREVVILKMAELQARCTGALKDIADIIPKLLVINPRDRPTANDLLQRLSHLAFNAAPPFDYENSDSSLVLPDLTNSSTLAYDSDSDSSGILVVKIHGATDSD